MANAKRGFYSVTEVASLLGVSERWVRVLAGRARIGQRVNKTRRGPLVFTDTDVRRIRSDATAARERGPGNPTFVPKKKRRGKDVV